MSIYVIIVTVVILLSLTMYVYYPLLWNLYADYMLYKTHFRVSIRALANVGEAKYVTYEEFLQEFRDIKAWELLQEKSHPSSLCSTDEKCCVTTFFTIFHGKALLFNNFKEYRQYIGFITDAMTLAEIEDNLILSTQMFSDTKRLIPLEGAEFMQYMYNRIPIQEKIG